MNLKFITHLKSFISVIHAWILLKLLKVVMMIMEQKRYLKSRRIGEVIFFTGEFSNYYCSSGIVFFATCLKRHEIKV